MSLFHSREWWSHKPEYPSECSPTSFLTCNIDEDPSNTEKLITGSFTGHLRIFSPSSPPKLEDLLLEVNLDDPILQLEVGRFISGTSRLALAILFPNKLSIYTVNAVKAAGTTTAAYFDLARSYTHRFPHHAFSFTYGPFGQPTTSPRDHLAVLTLDGQLLFYNQDTLAFTRYLPSFLFPCPFTYIRHLDSFLIATAAHTIECYRYSVLGESHQTDRTTPPALQEEKQTMEAEFRQIQHAKKLHTDWVANLGEPVLDMQVGRMIPGSPPIPRCGGVDKALPLGTEGQRRGTGDQAVGLRPPLYVRVWGCGRCAEGGGGE